MPDETFRFTDIKTILYAMLHYRVGDRIQLQVVDDESGEITRRRNVVITKIDLTQALIEFKLV